MTALAASGRTDTSQLAPFDRRRSTLAGLALTVGALWGIAFTIVALGFTLTPDEKPFRHTADYWYTGLGLPLVLSALTLVLCMHVMNEGRDGRRGRWGAVVMSVAMVVFAVMFVQALVQGHTSSWGPTYPLCVLVSDIALGLFVAGSWRVGLLPRWVLLVWWFGWFLGGPFAQGPTPLLLTAAYVIIGWQLTKARREGQPR